MKKILFVLFLIMVILTIVAFKNFKLFGFEETGSKSIISIKNNTSQELFVKIQISISEKTPVLFGMIKSQEQKQMEINWDLIRKTDLWGEGNIYLYINYQGKEIEKVFLGEIELYEDGRNYINNFKDSLEINLNQKKEIEIVVK